jgi:molybdopterin converting factor small subunit
MRVRVPSPLHSYTGGAAEVEGVGDTLGDVLADLDRRFPGLRFRIIDEQDRVRSHILIFVSGVKATELAQPVGRNDDIQIVAALSGG